MNNLPDSRQSLYFQPAPNERTLEVQDSMWNISTEITSAN